MSSVPQPAEFCPSDEAAVPPPTDAQTEELPRSVTREFLQAHERWWIAGLILVAVALRILLLGEPGLVDPSEARFATSAQRMLETGTFVTPMIHTHQGWENYWAKPPLHMWLTAASLRFFGLTTEAARLPGFISIILSAAMVCAVGITLGSRSFGLLATLVYLSCGGVFLFSAVSLTDPTLALWVSGAFFATFMALFAATGPRTRDWWYRGAFVALGLGFLTKGPVAIVLFAMGAGLWLLVTGKWAELRRVPWRSGIGLFCVCSIPWYLAAEIATPGFLRYFFVQENFLRFVSSDESGVRYGTLHTQPRGMIWVMFAAVALPWSVIGVGRLASGARWREALALARRSQRVLFLVCWASASPMFFSAARQVLPTYTFSALPAVAVLSAMGLASFIEGREARGARSPGIARVAGLFGTCGLVGAGYGLVCSDLPTGVGVVVIAIALFVVLAANRFRQSRAALVVPIAMMGLCALYAGVVAGCSADVSSRRSARSILDAVGKEVSAPSATAGALAVLYGAPHSVLFYLPSLAPTLPLVSMGSDLAQARAAGADRFLIKEGDLPKLSAEDLAQLELHAERGRWRYYRARWRTSR